MKQLNCHEKAVPRKSVETLISMGRKRALCVSALLVLFTLFYPVNAIDTITRTQFISDGDDEGLVSSDGMFKLGFFSPGNSRFRYIGIWFNKISVQTVVWVANRETPIKNFAGFFKIDEKGNLAIFDGNDSSSLWSTNVSVPTPSTKAMLLDSGNLVLLAENRRDKTETILWQSFDYPTDTLLPGMKFGLNKKTGLIHTISSWKSSDDPAPGKFSNRLDPNGLPQFFMYEGTVPRWRAGPWNGRNLNGIPDVTIHLKGHETEYSSQMDLNNYTFENNDNEVYVMVPAKNNTLFSLSMIDSMGTYQRLIWHESKKWMKFWTAPQDLCDEYTRCGANALCNEDMAVHCTCLPGFEPLRPQDLNLKCVEKRKVDGCGKGNGEGFVRLEPVKLPDARMSQFYSNMSLKECELECSKSCNCTGFASVDIYEDGRGCMVWFGELKDMRLYKDGQNFYLRVDAVELAAYMQENSKILGNKRLAIFVVPIVMEVPLLAACFYYTWRWHAKRKGKKKIQNFRSMLLAESAASLPYYKDSPNVKSSAENGHIDLVLFDLGTIIAATDNFSSSKKLGQGGFGPVYMGQLPNGLEIAVKRLSQNSGQGIAEFKNEVLLIAKLQHRNLVRLLGCCIEKDEKMLIYEFMPHKSLDYYIFDESRKLLLDWKKRFDIILGIARGILYLHQDSRLTIIHRDLKAGNILLDGEMEPKISDFGIARIFGGDQTQVKTTTVVGTFGYMSPEYALGGLFSMKSDVFSFGVLLLEIISGKKNSEFFPDNPFSYLIKYTWELWRDGNALEIVDSSIADSCPAQEVLRCIQVGLLCVQDDARERPNMLTTIFMLSTETPLPSPKQPTFSIRRAQNEPESSITGAGSSGNGVTMTTFSAR
ncbi:Receptor protein kinase [Melia azedarach]|uniref:Receptor protein kinase n=1 Tax=Melia azedarach TaxID=155640 RepID=A0ACC1WVU3_MELAZ|nr:Receptor protein kinase [Melia azedarach]